MSAAEDERVEQLAAEYEAELHAMQSGVAQSMEWDKAHTPKHLWVGINSAMVSHQALVLLLIEKGLFTKVEFYESLVKAMRAEKEFYEREISERLGVKVTLR